MAKYILLQDCYVRDCFMTAHFVGLLRFTSNGGINVRGSQYVADLRGLASFCKFGALQDEMVRDQLIVHTNCDKIRERLLLAVKLAVQVKSVKSVSLFHLARPKCATTSHECRQQRREHIDSFSVM